MPDSPAPAGPAGPSRPAGSHAAAPDGRDDAYAATRIFLRPIADPMAIGFLGLAGATLTVAGLELGWIPAAERHQVALVVMIFAPLLQLIACVFGFLGRDAVAATGMGVLAGSWAIIGALLFMGPAHSRSFALGTFLMLAAAGVLLSALTAAHGKLVPAAVMAVTGARFAFTGAYDLSGVAWVKTGAGIVGCVLAALALYAAIALELEGQRHRPILPTLRRHRGRTALEPYLAEQVSTVAAEAGVRSQL